MFLFEEARNNMLNRSASLGMDLASAIDSGLLSIQQIDPAELAPGQFSHAVMQAVERGVRVGRHRQPERLPERRYPTNASSPSTCTSC